jgi:hypothetical protein
MPQTTLPADQSLAMNRTIARLERVERITTPTKPQTPLTMVFSYPGVIAANIESPPWYPHRHGYIDTVRLSFRANVTGTNTIAVYVDGVSIQQFSITTGNKTAVAAAAIPVGIGSYVTVKTVTVTGADSDMSVQMAM